VSVCFEHSNETSVLPEVWGVFRVGEPLLTFQQRMCLVCVVCIFFGRSCTLRPNANGS